MFEWEFDIFNHAEKSERISTNFLQANCSEENAKFAQHHMPCSIVSSDVNLLCCQPGFRSNWLETISIENFINFQIELNHRSEEIKQFSFVQIIHTVFSVGFCPPAHLTCYTKRCFCKRTHIHKEKT